MEPRTSAETEWDNAKKAAREAEAEWLTASRRVSYERAKARAGLVVGRGKVQKWQVDDQLTLMERDPSTPLAAAVLDETVKRTLYDSAKDHAETLKQIVWRVSR